MGLARTARVRAAQALFLVLTAYSAQALARGEAMNASRAGHKPRCHLRLSCRRLRRSWVAQAPLRRCNGHCSSLPSPDAGFTRPSLSARRPLRLPQPSQPGAPCLSASPPVQDGLFLVYVDEGTLMTDSGANATYGEPAFLGVTLWLKRCSNQRRHMPPGLAPGLASSIKTGCVAPSCHTSPPE